MTERSITFGHTFSFILLLWSSLCIGQTIEPASIDDSVLVYKMNEIVVTAQRSQASASTLYEISSKEMANLDIKSPSEALNFTPGLHVYKISTNETVFMLRGFEQRQVSVFLDGVPISVPFDGKVDLSQFVGDDWQSIRISRGLASALYGANTLGGSVNIITTSQRPDHHFNMRLEGQTYGAYFFNLNYNNRFSKFLYAINFSQDAGGDFPLSAEFSPQKNENGQKRENSAYNKKSAGIKVYYSLNEKHQIAFRWNYLNNWYHIPPNSKIERVRYWRFPEWKRNVFSLNTSHEFGKKFNLRGTFFYDAYYNVLQSYKDNSYKNLAWKSTYDDFSFGFNIYPSLLLWEKGTTNAILSYKADTHRQQFRNSAFETYKMTTFTAGLEQNIVFASGQSALIGLDIDYLKPTKAAELELRPSILLFNAQAAWQYKSEAGGWKTHLSFGKKSRFPTLKELYSERLGRSEPNPDLKAEHAYKSEIGLKIPFQYGIARFNSFYSKLYDLIIYKEIGQGVRQLQNIGRAIIAGAEIGLQSRWKQFYLDVGYTYLYARNRSAERKSDFLPNRPEHRINLQWRWDMMQRLRFFIEGFVVANQYFENPDNLRWEKLNNYGVFNLKLQYAVLSFLDLYIRANNIADTNYESDYGVPMPGRTLLAGFRLGI